jgi:hypothetical protein
MSNSKRKSKRDPGTEVAVMGVAGAMSLLLAGATPAAAVGSADAASPPSIMPSQDVALSDEEIADVSLSTFFSFDRERDEAAPKRMEVAGRRCGTRCGRIRNSRPK